MMKILHSAEPIYARALSLGPWRRVYLGTRFAGLAPDQQVAVLAHEEGHCRGFHTEWRLLTLLLVAWWCPWAFFFLCRQQELAADAYAARKGYAGGLLSLLSSEYGGGKLQPSHASRRHHLKQYEYIPSRCPRYGLSA